MIYSSDYSKTESRNAIAWALFATISMSSFKVNSSSNSNQVE